MYYSKFCKSDVSNVKYQLQRNLNKENLKYGFNQIGITSGNKIHIYSYSDPAFEDLWKAIETAKKRVWLETYMIEPDSIGLKTLSLLEKAAKNGCEIRIIYDSYGSPKLNSSHLTSLKNSGAQVISFNPKWKLRDRGLFKNYRNMLIVDESLAFSGINFEKGYVTERIGGLDSLRDVHFRIEGPAVNDLSKIFLKSLEEMKIEIPPAKYDSIKPSFNSSGWLQILETKSRKNLNELHNSLEKNINTSIINCYITTPYFLPPQRVKSALIRASRRKVDVKIITRVPSSVPIIRYASQHVNGLMLRNGIQVYELYRQKLHSNIATIDGTFSMLGLSMNPLSNYQINVNISSMDDNVAMQLGGVFKRDFLFSTEVIASDLEKRSIAARFIHWASYHILRVCYFIPFFTRLSPLE